jgi:hypothetical protein
MPPASSAIGSAPLPSTAIVTGWRRAGPSFV